MFRNPDIEVCEMNLRHHENKENYLIPGEFDQKTPSTFPMVSLREIQGIHLNGNDLTAKGFNAEKQNRKIFELQKLCDDLREQVASLTIDSTNKTKSLEEAEIVIKVLLNERREEAKQHEVQTNINVERLILPYVEILEMQCGSTYQKVLLETIRSNLKHITSSFMHKNKKKLSKLTPTQIRVMDLIKHGHSTKEIASILNLSPSTVAAHRQAIRRRLSLNNKKIGLFAALNA